MLEVIKESLVGNSKTSCTRLISIICVPVVVCIPMLIWAILSLFAHKLLELPLSVTGFVSAVIAATLGTLHLNKRQEVKAQVEIK